MAIRHKTAHLCHEQPKIANNTMPREAIAFSLLLLLLLLLPLHTFSFIVPPFESPSSMNSSIALRLCFASPVRRFSINLSLSLSLSHDWLAGWPPIRFESNACCQPETKGSNFNEHLRRAALGCELDFSFLDSDHSIANELK